MIARDDARQRLADAWQAGDRDRYNETVSCLVESGFYDLDDIQQMMSEGPPQSGRSA
jgi:tartrate dehydratase beta subunit/fumarate hydratase class I family protein